jgi:hypothetical protein
MDISDRLKNLTDKAKDTAVEHKDQIRAAVEKAERSADQQTGGQYHDQIARAGETVKGYLDKLDAPSAGEAQPSADAEAPPEASAAPHGEPPDSTPRG